MESKVAKLLKITSVIYFIYTFLTSFSIANQMFYDGQGFNIFMTLVGVWFQAFLFSLLIFGFGQLIEYVLDIKNNIENK